MTEPRTTLSEPVTAREAMHSAVIGLLADRWMLTGEIMAMADGYAREAVQRWLASPEAERALVEQLDGLGDGVYSAAVDWIAGYKPKQEANENLARAILQALREAR